MEPTPKALQLQAPVRGDPRADARRCAASTFRSIPRHRRRTFNFCVVDAGLIKLLPPLVNSSLEEAPNVRLRVDAARSRPSRVVARVRQGRFRHGLVSGADQGNPPAAAVDREVCQRRAATVTRALATSRRWRHSRARSTCWSRRIGTGHAHQLAERAIEAAVPEENIICRVPMFIARRGLAKHTDAIATLPPRSRPRWRATWSCRSSRRRSSCRGSRSFSTGTTGFTATPAMRGFGGCLRGCFAGRRRGSARIAQIF